MAAEFLIAKGFCILVNKLQLFERLGAKTCGRRPSTVAAVLPAPFPT